MVTQYITVSYQAAGVPLSSVSTNDAQTPNRGILGGSGIETFSGGGNLTFYQTFDSLGSAVSSVSTTTSGTSLTYTTGSGLSKNQTLSNWSETHFGKFDSTCTWQVTWTS